MERLLCRWEPVYSLVLRSTGAYNQSLYRAFKCKSKTECCKPFVNLMFAGMFWNYLLHFRDWQLIWLWHPDKCHGSSLFCCTLSSLCCFQSARIFISPPSMIQYPLRMLICTRISSYLKDKSKHVCFLFVVFFFLSLFNSLTAFMSTLVIRTGEGFCWKRGAEDALMYS